MKQSILYATVLALLMMILALNVNPVKADLTTTTTTAYTDVLLDNIDPTNHVYYIADPSGSYSAYGEIDVPKSHIIATELIIRVVRHTDTYSAPTAPICTEQPIDMSTTPPTVPTGVYENDDAHTVHMGVWCEDGDGGHIVTPGGGWRYVSVTSDTGYEWNTSTLSWSYGAVQAGWHGWWFRGPTQWFQFNFTGIDTALINNYVTVGFYFHVTNDVNGEKGLDGLIDVIVNPSKVTIRAFCNTLGWFLSVSITMDGSPTGYNTSHTFVGLTGTHTFTVPDTDEQGCPFIGWSGPDATNWTIIETNTTITITVSEGGTHEYWWAHYEEIHDVAVIDVTTSPTSPSPVGELISINVTVENQGNLPETFDVSVYYTLIIDPLIGTQPVTDLLPGENRPLTFEWTPETAGQYEILANTTEIPDEVDIADNTRTTIVYVEYGSENPESSSQTVLYLPVALGISGFFTLSIVTTRKRRSKNLGKRQKEFDELLDELRKKYL